MGSLMVADHTFIMCLLLLSFLFFLLAKHTDDMYCICRGPPKKRAKSSQSSIVPLEEDAPAASMSFPPRFANYYFL
jgi:hypothetical protein